MSHRSLLLALALCLGLGLVQSPATADDKPATETKKEPAKAPALKRRPMLWMVEGPTRVYLYGTIHVADPRVVTHLPVVQQALDQSTALYTELRLDAAGQQQMQMAVMQRAPLTDGKTLKGVLGDELYARVEKAMPPSIPLMMMGGMKPWLINFILQQTLLQQHAKYAQRKAKAEGATAAPAAPGQALDMKLFVEAQQAGKQVGGLETIDGQIDVFDRLTLSTQVRIVKEVVKEIERFRALAKDGEEVDDAEAPALTKLIDLWLAGDLDGFEKVFAEDLRKQAGAGEEGDEELAAEIQKLVTGLLDDRNVGMAAKVQELMKADPRQVYFVAVGAGHMPGENGVVKLLEKAGLKVRRVELGETLPACPKPAPVAKKEPVGAGADK